MNTLEEDISNKLKELKEKVQEKLKEERKQKKYIKPTPPRYDEDFFKFTDYLDTL